MNDQKRLWEKLAKENTRFYIASSFGRGITEKQFTESGEKDYERLLTLDGKSELVRNFS